jgi:hypothetical protein
VLWDDPVVTAPADEPEPPPIAFGNGNKARLAEGRAEDAAAIVAGLGLESTTPTRPVILVCGGADLAGAALERADALIGTGVASAAKTVGAAVVDGATDAGVMRLTGEARARRPQALPILVGVAPKGLVSYPGGPEQGQERVPLEENHTHFVLADSAEWGGETRLMMDVAQALARGGRMAMVLAGGGKVARSEVQQAVRRGWPVFVAVGTGDLADELTRLWDIHRVRHRRRGAWLLPRKRRDREPTSPSAIADHNLREIITEADIRPVGAAVDPMQFARQLAWEVQDEPILKGAWQQFATYDYLAVRLRRLFTRFQSWILLLGVAGTLLALIQSEVKQTWLHWVVVVVPILASVLIAVVSRRAVGQRWVMMRAAAEFIKAEIYRYRALQPAHVRPADRRRLADQLDVIEARLGQTEASSGPVTPYNGPLPPVMYGAGRDDDGLSRLGADGYLRIRVDDQLSYFHGRVRTLNRRRNFLQSVSVASGATGAILAAASLETWIGLTAGVSAAALAYLGYLQVDNTIVTYNQTAFRLAALRRGWQATDQNHRTRTALEELITRCETALATEQAGWVQQMNDTLEHLRERQADEAKSIEGQDHPAGQLEPGDNHDNPGTPETS